MAALLCMRRRNCFVISVKQMPLPGGCYSNEHSATRVTCPNEPLGLQGLQTGWQMSHPTGFAQTA